MANNISKIKTGSTIPTGTFTSREWDPGRTGATLSLSSYRAVIFPVYVSRQLVSTVVLYVKSLGLIYTFYSKADDRDPYATISANSGTFSLPDFSYSSSSTFTFNCINQILTCNSYGGNSGHSEISYCTI